jgi:ribosomal protein S18 acetylase RimI-like enzyme
MTAWVAELNREAEGFLVGRLAAGEFEILIMAVSKAQRKKGIASRLLALALEWAQGAGGTRALLEVRASNEEAIRLYRRHGFAAWGRRKQYYRNPLEEALLFARTLAEHF